MKITIIKMNKLPKPLSVTPVITYQSRMFINHFTISINLKGFFFTCSINGFLHVWNIKFQFPIFHKFYKNHHFVFISVNEKSNLLVSSSNNTQILLFKVKKKISNENINICTVSKNTFRILFTYLKFFEDTQLFLCGFRIIFWDILHCKSKNITSKSSKKIKKIIFNKV